MYNAGDTPGAGKYQCTNCGHIQDLKSGEKLAVCPVCGNKTFTKVDDKKSHSK